MRIKHFIPALLSVALLSGVMSCHKDDDDNSSNNSVAANQTISGVYVCTGAGSYVASFMKGVIEFSGDNAKYNISYYDSDRKLVNKVEDASVVYTGDGKTGFLMSSTDTLDFAIGDEGGFVAIAKKTSNLPVFKTPKLFSKTNLAFADYGENPVAEFESPYSLDDGPESDCGLHRDIEDGANGSQDAMLSEVFDISKSQAVKYITTKFALSQLGSDEKVLDFARHLDVIPDEVKQMERALAVKKLDNALAIFDEEFKAGCNVINKKNQFKDFFDQYYSIRKNLESLVDGYYSDIIDDTKNIDRREALSDFCYKKSGRQCYTFLIDWIFDKDGPNKKIIYHYYDYLVYNTFAWEYEGYFYREAIRLHDCLVLRKTAELCMLYLAGNPNLADYEKVNEIKIVADKFDEYLDYFNAEKFVRDNDNAVCQIPGCHIKIRKKLDVLDIYGSINKNGRKVYFHPSENDPDSYWGLSSKSGKTLWLPGDAAMDIVYYCESIYVNQYCKMGVKNEYLDKIRDFYKNSPIEAYHNKTLIDILTQDAGCILPDIYLDKQKYILPMYDDNWTKSEKTKYIWLDQDSHKLTLNVYDYSNNHHDVQVGVVQLTKATFAPYVSGWTEYNHNNVWIFPILTSVQK